MSADAEAMGHDVGQPLPEALLVPHPNRLAPNHPRYGEIMAAHRAAVAAGEAGYDDPATGLFVFSAAYLWGRGWCCQQGCRHCPYAVRPS